MKNVIFTMLLCAVTFFTSCSKDEDDLISKNNIVGTWEARQIKVDGDWIAIPSNSKYSMSVTFYEDGRYYGESDFFGTGYGTYNISGNSIKTYVDGEYMYTYQVNNITDSMAEVTMIDEDSSSGESLNIRLNKTKDEPNMSYLTEQQKNALSALHGTFSSTSGGPVTTTIEFLEQYHPTKEAFDSSTNTTISQWHGKLRMTMTYGSSNEHFYRLNSDATKIYMGNKDNNVEYLITQDFRLVNNDQFKLKVTESLWDTYNRK